MKIKGPLIKIMPLNEINKHILFKLNFDIGILFDSFQNFPYPYYSISTTSGTTQTNITKIAKKLMF